MMWSTVILFLVFLLSLRVFKTLQLRAKLPPGPKGLPILGNLLQLQRTRPWLAFDKWTKQYGPIVYLNIAGQNTVVLGTRKAAVDLFERQSNVYSDRTHCVVLNVLAGGMHWAWRQADELWKRQR
ncbi:cytochrome P450 [Lentinula aciculospora]|uniref:Cytochrome P450 n=1 Tax=Lentinula aciculospora TaxID=153920 RepID=A0A9W8ZZW1_9AGAR|nr:cytochrome P450 [Lentinula aciculospora]